MPEELSLMLPDGLSVKCTQTAERLTLDGPAASLAKFFRTSTRSFPYLDVLHTSFDTRSATLVIHFLPHKQHQAGMHTLKGSVMDSLQADRAALWASSLMSKAYPNGPARRRYKVLLNPASGQGKARKMWSTKIAPVFAAAGATVEYEETKRAGHAAELMAKLDLATFDAVVLISGDGLIHEVFNGLARRPDGAAALRSLPIGCVPAGTSNGLWVSIAGPHDCKSLAFALLNVLKGEPLPMDLCLVSQASKPILYSFLTQAYGLLAECDLGTEHLRWMGGKRVYVGYAAGVLANKAYPCEIWAKIVSQDKQAIREDVKKGSHRTGMEPDTAELESMRSGSLDEPLEGQDGWTRLDMDSVAIFYAGKVVWVDPGVMAFPGAADDGLIDVAIMRAGNRKHLLTAMDGAENGAQLAHPAMLYYKVEAYRLVPKKKTYLAVDGESIDCAPIQVECRRGAAACLSIASHYYHGDSWKAPP